MTEDETSDTGDPEITTDGYIISILLIIVCNKMDYMVLIHI